MSELRFVEFSLLDGALPGRVEFTLADDPDLTKSETVVTVQMETVAKSDRSFDSAQITVLNELRELVSAEIEHLEDVARAARPA